MNIDKYHKNIYNYIFLCKIITQYTCTYLHSMHFMHSMETESTLVDNIAKECMHPVFSDNVPCMH